MTNGGELIPLMFSVHAEARSIRTFFSNLLDTYELLKNSYRSRMPARQSYTRSPSEAQNPYFSTAAMAVSKAGFSFARLLTSR